MKYDSIRTVEAMTRPSETVEIKQGKVKKQKRQTTAFDVVFAELAICIVASVAFLVFSIFTKSEPVSIGSIFDKIITSGSRLLNR